MSVTAKVTVVGAGIVGLSVARVLAGTDRYAVHVVASGPPSESTSAIAAAFWEPYHVAGIDPQWAEDSHSHYLSLVGQAGVFHKTLRRYFGSASERIEWERDNPWHSTMPVLRYRRMPPSEVHPDFQEGALYDVPVIHMPSHLAHLEEQLRKMPNVSWSSRTVDNLASELADCDALVNCAGLGNRDIADVKDANLYSCRGQIVILDPLPEIDMLTFITTGVAYEHRPLYIVPRGPIDVVCGGTADDDEYDLTPNPAVTREIIERCARHCPAIRHARIRDVKVGRRPARRGPVCFGRDATRDYRKPVVHCFGHGGAGVTLSWGCAQAVLRNLESPDPQLAPI